MTYSYQQQPAPKTTAPASGATTSAGGTGNQARLDQLGLDGGFCPELPNAGEYDGMCWIPLILKRSSMAGDELVEEARLAEVAARWGVTVPGGSVRRALDGGSEVVELMWPAVWGARPKKSDLTGGLTVVEAKTAAAALAEQAGWSKVPVADQTRLVALVGGESSALSASARTALKALLDDGDWGTKSADDQGQALVGLLTSDAARPNVVDEPVDHLKPAKFTLSAAALVKDHEFRGSKQDADLYTQTFDGSSDTVKIYAPHSPSSSKVFHTVQQTAEAVARLPEGSRKVVRTVTLNAVDNPDDAYWAREYGDPNFHSYMTAGASGDVTIYPSSGSTPSENYMRGTMIHETGHTWAYKTWGNDETRGGWVKWKEAMGKDKISVSDYATNSIAEDVAETIQIYGGSKGTPTFDEYRTMVPARFAILDAQL